MKRLFTFFVCALALSLTACAATSSRITITVTITNNPSAGNTFVPNASTHTWRASPTIPSTEITIGANIGASATNLFRQLASYTLAGPVDLGFSSSNVVTIRGSIGEAMSATTSGTWATVTYSTNTIYPMNVVRVPAANEPTQSTATNIQSQLALDLGTYSTNALPAGTVLLSHILQTSGDQYASGVKSFSQLNANGVIISNTVPVFELWDLAGAASKKRVRWQMDGGTLSSVFEDDAGSDIIDSIRITKDVIELNVPLHPLGNSIDTVTVTNGTIVQSIFAETNSVTGIWGHARANNTSLANGNNAGIDFGAKVFVKIKAGPSASFAICGIAGGADGRELVLYNATGQTMTISNDSGVEPTAANRIYTNTGADVSTTGNGAVRLIYDSEDSRWVVLSLQQ